MNIGLDIDNVITAFDAKILKEFLREDKSKRNVGIINKKSPHIVRGMFDWSEQEVRDFFAENMERIAKDLKPRFGCRRYMRKLKKDGHKLILISHRAYPDYKQPEKTTTEWLTRYSIPFDKLILSKSPDKSEECLKNDIELMIDDRVTQCRKMRGNGVNCVVMLTRYNRSQIEDMPFVESWQDLYRKINRETI